MPRRGEAASLPRVIGGVIRAANVSGEGLEPVVLDVLVDHFKHRPDEALAEPGVFLGIDAAGSGDGIAGQSGRRWEGDVGADPIRSAGVGTKMAGQPLGEPALHATGVDRDHLGGKWIGQRVAEEVTKTCNQTICALGSVYVQQDLCFRKSLEQLPPVGTAVPTARRR